MSGAPFRHRPIGPKFRPGGNLLRRNGATDGTRTRDNLNHNQGLYQLSYGHRLGRRETRRERCESKRRISEISPPDGMPGGLNLLKIENGVGTGWQGFIGL